MREWTADEVLAVLNEATDAVVAAFSANRDWGKSGLRHDQYVPDLVADEAVLDVLGAAGIRVLSEESGLGPERPGPRPERPSERSEHEWGELGPGSSGGGLVAVVDPLDGSTNASLSLPWFATSLCVVDDKGPWVAVVHDHPGNRRYTAIRGRGADLDGVALQTPPLVEFSEAVVAVNGLPPASPGWWQFRTMGSCALELCAVADGRFAGFVDFADTLHVWDYLGAVLICSEVGVAAVDAEGRDLACIDHKAQRSPVAAPPALFPHLLALRRGTSGSV
ncbi:MAG: inositol monophosphatase [Acidimicrobiaceae bacterium]|nr:inositol monophosphatase [Acidimicrobiaceae bacterium]MXW61637.1 inositol monophosphatase [Acidimicrobiaceae bacterium]MXW75435.1 inositol monophosphatase [Acidimicrobiaceae bacterium]MYA73866.1 inositol monophosphatase [Acidimicrobiaceae bacterium]MYC43821.1 inositol monophosphatase [Acidimicrobiaceae bacterium]